MDVIALAINKRHPEFNIARGIRYINFMVLALGFYIRNKIRCYWRFIQLGQLIHVRCFLLKKAKI